MERPGFNHSWEEIQAAIKKMEDSQIKVEEAAPGKLSLCELL